MNSSNYDKFPHVEIPHSAESCVVGWDEIARRVAAAIARRDARRTVVTVECYPGVDEDELLAELERRLQPRLAIRASEALLPRDRVEALVEPFLGGDDPVFGFMSNLVLPQWFEPGKIDDFRRRIATVEEGVILAVGCGAWHVFPGDLLVYADLARWEAQQRFRRGETGNLGARNKATSAGLKYKRAFFVDWRACDRWKRPLLARCHFLLDSADRSAPKLAEGETIRRALRHVVTRPFRVVPFFDPAPWGGRWMHETCDLDRAVPNFGWCFDCVPEENSLVLQLGNVRFEIPSINLVFDQPRPLLGEAVQARFGDEFPIRFDLLDTMGGGNLSFQVHPLTEYIQRHFGMRYTQDESYYILDAGPRAAVLLGLREGIDPEEMTHDLRRARQGDFVFPAKRYVNRWPAKKHDHFLIPAGTCHCSNADCMVLEISATPYIFTFKMWDWERAGLDGKPRPIHLEHGLANIQWDRTTRWVEENLINRVAPVASGDGWREERTGLHEREFIETRRHWFHKPVRHRTGGAVNVLNLIEGREAIVESPHGAFEPFVVHYAETFIVPAAVGEYVVRPLGATPEKNFATIAAFVRT